MLGSKFLVPCDPVGYLTHQYGPMSLWSVPDPKDYKWFNLERVDEWNDFDWPYAIRYYDRFGNVERKRTIEKLNEQSKFNFTQIPVEDFQIDYKD